MKSTLVSISIKSIDFKVYGTVPTVFTERAQEVPLGTVSTVFQHDPVT